MIVIPSLAAARDVVAHVARLEPGTVMRATAMTNAPGGKALNVGRLLGAAGIACQLVALVDARTQAELERALSNSVEAHFVRAHMELRTDIHVVDNDGGLTVINAQPAATPADVEHVIAQVATQLEADDVLLVAGRQPDGAASRLFDLARERGARLVVDTSGPDLRLALEARPWLVKVNLAELAAATNRSEEEVWRSAPQDAGGAANLVVSHGAAGVRAWPATDNPFEIAASPAALVNPLGAGDALMAGLLADLDGGADLRSAVTTGVAWATDLVSRLELSVDLAGARGLRDQLQVNSLSGG